MIDEQARPQNITRGVILVVAVAFSISVQDVVFKLFSNALTFGQIFALRGMLMLPMLFLLAWTQGRHHSILADALEKWVLLRSVFLTMTFLGFYAAIPFLNLSTVGAANYVAPIFVTLLSAYVIGEPVGPRGWCAVFIGFAGVVLLLQPGTDAFSFWAILPLCGAAFYACAHITTRAKCQKVPLTVMAMSVNLVMLTSGLLVSATVLVIQPDPALVQAYPYILGTWASVGPSEWMILGFLAALSVVIYILLAGAYQAAPPSTVATFEYSYLVFVVIWDAVVFAILPNGTSLAGMVMIIGAGLLVLRR